MVLDTNKCAKNISRKRLTLQLQCRAKTTFFSCFGITLLREVYLQFRAGIAVERSILAVHLLYFLFVAYLFNIYIRRGTGQKGV